MKVSPARQSGGDLDHLAHAASSIARASWPSMPLCRASIIAVRETR